MKKCQLATDVKNADQTLKDDGREMEAQIELASTMDQDQKEEAPNQDVAAGLSSSIAPLLPEYQQLLDQCVSLGNTFRKDLSERGQRLCAAFDAWQDFIELANKLVLLVEAFAGQYDFDATIPGNGYRSFITITNACINYGNEICRNLNIARSTMFFRKKFYTKEVEACSQLLSSICTCLQYLLILHGWSKGTGDLFAQGEHSAEELFEMGDTINQYCFYGRCLGFQYGESIRGVLRFISISMAGFSESFYSQDGDGTIAKTTRSVWTSGKYFLNPESRARRIVNISQNAKIDFCKSFWFLAESELMHKIPSLVGSSIKVNRVIEIPSEPLQLPRCTFLSNKPDSSQATPGSTEFVDIPVPSSHLGTGNSVTVRLLSHIRREGMLGEGGNGIYRGWHKLAPRSSSILLHCHGGGFVAQSSKSHELYLRDWAVAINTPILSVDYSLAPEAPFPRALEEVFYAYCWMLRNSEYLGSTVDRVVLAGDSAGANLCVGVALKCIELGIRKPDGIFLAYCPTLVSFVPSPARLLCLMDPLLPFGFMMRCLRAYASPDPEVLANNLRKSEDLADIRNAHVQQTKLQLNNCVQSALSSRRNSLDRSQLSSPLEEHSKSEQIQLGQEQSTLEEAVSPDRSSDTFASASYHTQTVERTDLFSAEEDNSFCVSFEDDSQPIVYYPLDRKAADVVDDHHLIDISLTEAKENGHLKVNGDVTMENNDKEYVLRPVQPITVSEENLILEIGKEMMAFDTLNGRFNYAIRRITSTLRKYTKSAEICNGSNRNNVIDLRNMDALIARSPSMEFAFQVPKDPFLSPYWAPDDWLKQMPPTKILTLDMDPCLDDCVMFAKKLKNLKRPVSLDILKGLPHGFLNFTMLSNEAMEGSRHCIKCLQELLKMPETSAAV